MFEKGPQTVLVVDDEPLVIDIVASSLGDDGFHVVRAADGPSAVAAFTTFAPDLVVLDINLPGFPGTEVLRRIRAVRDVPVIFLTDRVSEVDRVVGLELGADDYVGKPFSPRELVARVRAVLRRLEREPQSAPSTRCLGPIAIDSLAHEIRINGRAVALTATQFRLLVTLIDHAGQTLTREQLLAYISSDSDVFDRTLDRHIANLRSRIEPDPAHPVFIKTVFGVGYTMARMSA